MTSQHIAILFILVAMFGLLIWGRLRHDIVALLALLASVTAGLVDAKDAFLGFGHPAVVTVACVLVLSRALVGTGVIDAFGQKFAPSADSGKGSIIILILLVAIPSAFINNVGALAMTIPIGLRFAEEKGLAPGRVLMPMAFGSMLGGMTTLAGTPPNLIVSGYRAGLGGNGFSMFDFTPVGGLVAIVGIIFLAFTARFLVPNRQGAVPDSFDIGAYLTEAVVPEESKAIGQTLYEVENELEKSDAQILGLVRNGNAMLRWGNRTKVRLGDILMIEADPKALATSLDAVGLRLAEAVLSQEKKPEKTDERIKSDRKERGPAKSSQTEMAKKQSEATASSELSANSRSEEEKRNKKRVEQLELSEVVVLPGSSIEGLTVLDIDLRARYGIDLLAASRQGSASVVRLRARAFQAGDVLMLQGGAESVAAFCAGAGCAPLAARTLRVPDRRRMLSCLAVAVITIVLAASGLMPPALAFLAGATAMMVLGFLPLRSVYSSIDGPVIVLLAALIPVAGALASTGLADLLARQIVALAPAGSPTIALIIVMLATMTLSDIINNAATAAIMCPIAAGVAASLGVNPDGFLMAVAVGASCAFLTPIGHQNNTLIMGPGGFRFGDYWPLGLPLQTLVLVVSILAITWVWPLS